MQSGALGPVFAGMALRFGAELLNAGASYGTHTALGRGAGRGRSTVTRKGKDRRGTRQRELRWAAAEGNPLKVAKPMGGSRMKQGG
jgi:hypothetical protein